MENNNQEETQNPIRKGIILGVLACGIILGGFFASYGYFIGSVQSQKETLTVQTGSMALTFSDGNNGFAKELDFGGSAEKTFTVENTGSIKSTFSILWMNLENNYLEESLTYTLAESDTEDGTYTPLVTNKNVPVTDVKSDIPLFSGIEIEPSVTKYYKLTITLNYLESIDQTSDLNARLSTQFKIVEGIIKTQTSSEKTLAKLGKTSKSIEGLDFALQANTDETNDGLYAMEDDYGTSYFYRGDVTDNYVKFADMYWRIIRVNGDGSVRLLYDGTSAHTNSDTSADRYIMEGQKFNTSYNDAKYVGYMYAPTGTTASTSKEQAQTNTASSDIKTALENWYVTNIRSKNLDEYVADTSFCYDRTTPGKDLTGLSSDTGLGYGTNVTAYGATARLGVWNSATVSTQPQFTCPNKNDAYTKEDTEKGNGAISEKIGLITADEAVAGGTGKHGLSTNTNNYLYKNKWYWSGSPFYYSSATVFTVYTGHLSNYYDVNSTAVAAAPVINLTSDYFNTFVGDGKIGNEFRLSTE